MPARGVHLLGAVRAGEAPVPFAELARRACLPRSTTHRLAMTLTACGFLDEILSPAAGGYVLGTRLIMLGEPRRVPSELRTAALSRQRALALGTGRVSHLVSSGPTGPTWLTCAAAVPTVPTEAHRAALAAADAAPASRVAAVHLPGLTALAVRVTPLATLTLVTPAASASGTRAYAHALWRAAAETCPTGAAAVSGRECSS